MTKGVSSLRFSGNVLYNENILTNIPLIDMSETLKYQSGQGRLRCSKIISDLIFRVILTQFSQKLFRGRSYFMMQADADGANGWELTVTVSPSNPSKALR